MESVSRATSGINMTLRRRTSTVVSLVFHVLQFSIHIPDGGNQMLGLIFSCLNMSLCRKCFSFSENFSDLKIVKKKQDFLIFSNKQN